MQEGTNLQEIQELKELIGPKVQKITIPALKEGERPTEMNITGGLGQLATLTTSNVIEINQKLGKSIERVEVDIFNPEKGVMEKTAIAGGIGAATMLMVKDCSESRKKFEKVGQWLMSGQILEVLTFAATLHNAHQLSVSILDTLVQAAQNIVEAIGIKDDEGNTIDIQEMMKKNMEQLMIAVLGKEAYETAKKKWDIYNRIYQSASNILSAMTSIINALQDTTEVIGSYVGKIGNALKRYHVIADNAYEWMSEKMSAKNRWQRRLNALVEGLEQAENLTSNLEQVTSNTLEIVQQSQELVKESRELKKLLSESEPDEKNENKPIAEQQKLNKEVSKPPEIKEEDIMSVATRD